MMSLANVQFHYDNAAAGEQFGVDVGRSTVIAEKIDLRSHYVALKEFLAEDTHIVVVEPKRSLKAAKDEPPRNPGVSASMTSVSAATVRNTMFRVPPGPGAWIGITSGWMV